LNTQIAIHWFRRDLRLEDNTALFHALTNNEQVLPLFIFDTEILDSLEDKADARVQFIFDTLMTIRKKLRATGNDIYIAYGSPMEVFKNLISQYTISAVYTNHDFEPYAIQRDNAIKQFLATHNIAFKTCKDQVIFEKDEVLKDDGKPYTIYTPYSKKWKLKLTADDLVPRPSEKYLRYLYQTPPLPEIGLQQIGFLPTEMFIPVTQLNLEIVKNYHNTRDLPAVNGTTRMSVHLRFGTVSIRHLARLTQQVNEKYFNELIWREFYQMILAHFPHVVTKSFKPEYDRIVWRNNETEYQVGVKEKQDSPL
jgi:deoxyribodipyrimidine photo-lyase